METATQKPVPAAARDLSAISPNRQYRDDIQGVRALGAILIMIYHIWLGKVSGGVDVFFVVSGYMMTTVLLKQVEDTGRIRPLLFLSSILKRISPSAYLVLLTTLVLGAFFLPPPFWRVDLNHYIASALHLENIQLIETGANYLAREEPPSPVQQFWALSIQMQFYVVLPGVIYCALRAGKLRLLGLGPVTYVLFLWALSLAWSVYATTQTPDSAYFDPAARLWEFLSGAIVALVVTRIALGERVAEGTQALGLFALLATGILLPSTASFPGLAALMPVIGAGLIILGGNNPAHRNRVRTILSASPLSKIGEWSFTIYLWHWPILVYFQHHLGRTNLSLAEGVVVMAAAVLLAAITASVVDGPARRLFKDSVLKSLFYAGAFALPALAVGVAARLHVVAMSTDKSSLPTGVAYSDASLRTPQDDASSISRTYFTAFYNDLPAVFSDGCNTGTTATQVIVCEYGDVDADTTVALVGGSHIAQLQGLFDQLGKEHGFRLLNITKAGCTYGVTDQSNESCLQWNSLVDLKLAELRPQFVVLNSTRADRNDAEKQLEFTPASYEAKIASLSRMGVTVVGLRDNPWFEEHPAACLWRNPQRASACARPRASVYSDPNPADQLQARYDSFISIDLTDLYCNPTTCPAFVDGIIIYRDLHHFTNTYALFIKPGVEKILRDEVPAMLR